MRADAFGRRTYARRRVSIIVYHDPSPERLESHLRYLRERYTFLSLSELVDALHETRWPIDSPSVVLTFDDGHRGNARLETTLTRFGVTPTIYICTGIIEGDGMFWFKAPDVDPEPLKVMTATEREAVLGRRRDAVATAGRRREALTPDEVSTLARVVEFGSHTSTHPILPLSDDQEARDEIVVSRAAVGRLCGRPCLHFSYPNGDFREREIAFVRQAGYKSARTTEVGWVGPRSDPFRLPIVSLADHATVDILAAHLTGLLALKRYRGVRRHRRALGVRRPATSSHREAP
jgi:peptidoglycan/xylan/chitin deacetylase (PgdA/CDA1 family)